MTKASEKLTMTINGEPVEYTRSDLIQNDAPAKQLNGCDFAIVRSRNHGVVMGYVVKIDGQTVELINSRRIYYFKGAQTLEELAVYGTKKIDECKICPAVELPEIMLEACGVIYCTETARQILTGAKEWTA